MCCRPCGLQRAPLRLLATAGDLITPLPLLWEVGAHSRRLVPAFALAADGPLRLRESPRRPVAVLGPGGHDGLNQGALLHIQQPLPGSLAFT